MEISEVTKKYWREEDWQDLEKAQKVADLYSVAQRIINRMEKPLAQVCGPITSGGLGTINANLDVFDKTIKRLQKDNLNVFDQMPFEKQMEKLSKKLISDGAGFSDILTCFYEPLFESGVIDTFYFMPNWQSSKGANWEHQKAQELGIKIIYL